MNSKFGITMALLVRLGGLMSAQTGAVSMALTVSDNGGRERILIFGLDPAATDGIDTVLGESRLPPPPPTGAFDARFVGDDIGKPLGQGLWVDYRQGDVPFVGTVIHEIRYQTTSGMTITISWDLPNWASGRLQDIITGSLVDVVMAGIGSYTVTNPSGIPKLKMSITYDLPLPIELSSFTATQVGGNNVRLAWTTLSEVNNYGFHVQRRSAEDPEFQNLANGFVAGNGTTNIPHQYEYIDVQVPSGSWFYRLKQVDFDSDVHYTDPIHLEVLTDVKGNAPNRFELLQNYPNPFNPSTEIRFSLEFAGHASLEVINVLGQKMMTLYDETAEPGKYYTVNLDTTDLSSGVYFYLLRSGTRTDTRRFLIMK